MEEAADEVPSPPELVREPKRRAPRKKPDLSGVDPKAITIKTKAGEKTFSARSKPKKVETPVEASQPANPWTSVIKSWLD